MIMKLKMTKFYQPLTYASYFNAYKYYFMKPRFKINM